MKYNPNTWGRKYRIYEKWIGPNGVKWHFFWWPTHFHALAWPFYCRYIDAEPYFEISLKECIERGYKKIL